MREEAICPYCNKVVAPYDPERRAITGTPIICHGFCQDEAMANARKDKDNGNQRMPAV